MKLKISSKLIGATFCLLCGCTSQEKHIASWSFEENLQTETLESVHNLYTPVQSLKKNLELVSGISGNGLRTDGYSTFINAKLPKEISAPISIEGWFALETYPSDTAAFFSLQQDSVNYISACINQFGRPIISVCNKGTLNRYAAENLIEKFEWLNVALSISETEASLFLNGEKTASASLTESQTFSELILGRDTREKKIHIFPITYINGIIDEIKVWNKTLAENDFNKKEINKLAQITPKLAIPEIRFESDFHRPKYHILPAANWTNETHGLIYHKGKYHIFNQKNGANVYLGRINWGHFSSPDLVQWTEHKPVLTPEEGYDQYGIWSGHAVIDDSGKPTIMYTGGDGKEFGMCLATSEDEELINWKKFENNPVVQGPPKHFSRVDFRDPYLWKEGDVWYMIIGFGVVEDSVEKGTVLLYKSTDMKNWEYLHPLFTGNHPIDDTGIFWEMPVFQKIGQKYILLVNKVPNKGVPARALYWVGDFVNEKFVPDNPIPQNLEVINRLLSPSVTFDKNGLLTAIAIIPDEFGGEATSKLGWTHLYSIPRVWTLKDGKILQSPHPALKELREEKKSFQNQQVVSDKPLLISTGHQQIEIEATIDPGSSKKFGFLVGENPDHSEFTSIYFDTETREMVVDQAHSSLKEHIPLSTKKDKYDLDLSKPVDFHLYIDGSVVEVFINNEDAFTTRIFPLKESSNQVEIFTEGATIGAKAYVWNLKSAIVKTDF